MTYLPPALQTVTDESGTVITDAPCRKCSYNLRGLNQMGRCPECGTPVGLSICGDYLRFSDPAWLQKVATGLSLILWGILASIVVKLTGKWVFRAPAEASAVLAIVGGGLGVVGTWMMTTPDPSGIGEDTAGRVRAFTRVAVCSGVASQVLQLANVLLMRVGVDIPLVFPIALVLVSVVGVIGEFTKFAYIRALALRIPNMDLAKFAKNVQWGYGISLGVLVLIGAAAIIGISTGGMGGNTSGMMAAGCFAAIAGLAMLVYAIMGIVLLFRMQSAMAAQRIVAEQIWREQGGEAGDALPSAGELTAAPPAQRA